MNQTLVLPVDSIVGAPENGEIVRCGPADAVWEVRWHKFLSGDRIAISLEPKDPNDVDLEAVVTSLPSPTPRAVTA
jgi:hypothetical protein